MTPCAPCTGMPEATVWVLVIWALELTTGGLLRLLVGTTPWIYRDGWQVYGLIRLDMAPLWFAVGLLFEKIHDRLDRWGAATGK